MIFTTAHRTETGARFLQVFSTKNDGKISLFFLSPRYVIFYVFFDVIFVIFTRFSRNMHGASTRATFLIMAHTCLKVVKRDFCFPSLHFRALV